MTSRSFLSSIGTDCKAIICTGARCEFTLVEILLRHSGQVMSRQQLLDLVWGYDYDPGSNVVDVYVRHLRNKLGGDRIETVRGIGYRLRT